MKGPMKGAAIAHSKQRVLDGRYIGITEPGIISSEAPNPIVNPLVIMPDIEKRLEAFVRLGHGIIVFPGGAGTAEELMYILGILSHPRNDRVPFPLILTGPKSSEGYFAVLARKNHDIRGASLVVRLHSAFASLANTTSIRLLTENPVKSNPCAIRALSRDFFGLDAFVRGTLGGRIAGKYVIIIDDPQGVALAVNRGLLKVKAWREQSNDSYYFNRNLYIPPHLQEHFEPSHERVRELVISKRGEPQLFAETLRRVFSAVVWGNVKLDGVKAIQDRGPLQIRGDRDVMQHIDTLLSAFVEQGRMRLVGEYKPVYRIARR